MTDSDLSIAPVSTDNVENAVLKAGPAARKKHLKKRLGTSNRNKTAFSTASPESPSQSFPQSETVSQPSTKSSKLALLANTPRNVALQILVKFDQPSDFKTIRKPEGSRSREKLSPLVRLTYKADELMNEALFTSASSWSPADRHLLHQLVMGTLREWQGLTASLVTLSHFPMNKMHPLIRTLLRLGMYQLAFLQRVPDYAVINETVKTARALKISDAAVRFVNATMRAFQRQLQSSSQALRSSDVEKSLPHESACTLQPSPKTSPEPSSKENLAEKMFSQQSGWPLWLVQRWSSTFSPETLKAMASVWKHPAPLACRVNTFLKSSEAYAQELAHNGIAYECPFPETLPECFVLPEWRGTPTQLPGFEEGWVFVQDLSSAHITPVLAPQPGERILDTCAAPGSKTTHIAQRLAAINHQENSKSCIVALDYKPERLKRLQANWARLQLPPDGITPICSTLEAYVKTEPDLFDRILIDAPCSGLGTLRRHPEILIQLAEADLQQFQQQQLQLIRNAAVLLKSGGTLVYSVCSLDSAETREVVRLALSTLTDFKCVEDTLTPINSLWDGFYWAKFQKR